MNVKLSAFAAFAGYAAALSAWDAQRWRVSFDVGRTDGDASMPADWAKSGARMAFSFDVDVLAEAASEKDAEIGRGALALRPTSRPEFVGERGVQYVDVGEGGWKVGEAAWECISLAPPRRTIRGRGVDATRRDGRFAVEVSTRPAADDARRDVDAASTRPDARPRSSTSAAASTRCGAGSTWARRRGGM